VLRSAPAVPRGNFPCPACIFGLFAGSAYPHPASSRHVRAITCRLFLARSPASSAQRWSADGSRTGRRAGRSEARRKAWEASLGVRWRRGHTWPRASWDCRRAVRSARFRPMTASSCARRATRGAASRRSSTASTSCRSDHVHPRHERARRGRLRERHHHRAPPGGHRRRARARPPHARRRRRAPPRRPRDARHPRDARRLLLQLLRHHVARADEQPRLVRRLLVADRGAHRHAAGLPRARAARLALIDARATASSTTRSSAAWRTATGAARARRRATTTACCTPSRASGA
jgi:hypothetical protein